MTSLACAASVVIGVIRKASFGLYFRSIAGFANHSNCVEGALSLASHFPCNGIAAACNR